jgi:hypothetical protein
MIQILSPFTVSSSIVYVPQDTMTTNGSSGGGDIVVVPGETTPPLVILFMVASHDDYGAFSVTTMESTQQKALLKFGYLDRTSLSFLILAVARMAIG